MSEIPKTNGITMLIANNHIHANADVTFTVEERGDVSAVHVSDAVGKLILDNLRQQEEAVLAPGSYKGSLTLVISTVELSKNEVTEEEKPKKKAAKKKIAKKAATKKTTKKATKKRAVRKTKNS